MAKVLRCFNFVSGCDFTIRAATEEEVLKIAEEHGRVHHDMKEFDEAVKTRLRAAMTDEEG